MYKQTLCLSQDKKVQVSTETVVAISPNTPQDLRLHATTNPSSPETVRQSPAPSTTEETAVPVANSAHSKQRVVEEELSNVRVSSPNPLPSSHVPNAPNHSPEVISDSSSNSPAEDPMIDTAPVSIQP